MTANFTDLRAPWPLLWLLCCALLLPGCRTARSVDWDSRVGTFTYDEAVTELGPPGSVAPLSTGGSVAEWLEKTSPKPTFSVGVGGFGGNVGVGASQTVGGGISGTFLILTFGADGRLTSWKRLTR